MKDEIPYKQIKQAKMASIRSNSLAHKHSNKSILDQINQKMLDSLQGLTSKAHCSYSMNTPIILSSTPVTVKPFTEVSTPVNITLVNGVFTALTSGIYNFTLERIYQNNDQNPSNPIEVTLSMKYNNIESFERTITIGAATSPQEPSILSFSTNRIITANSGDIFEFYVSAQEVGGAEAEDVELLVMEVTAFKLYDL